MSAIALVVLLATTLLAAGPLYTTAVTEAGLQRRLETAPPADVGIEIVLRSPATAVGDLDPAVRGLLDDALGDVIATVDQVTESDSVRGDLSADATNTSFAVVGARGLLRTIDEVPATPGVLSVAVHEEALAGLGTELGRTLDLTSRDGTPVVAQVTRVVVPVDPADRRWWDQPLIRDGVVEGSSFTRVGPLLVDDLEAFGDAVGDARVASRWRVSLAPGAIGTDTLRAVRSGVGDVVDAVGQLPQVGSVEVLTGLDGLLTTTVTELRATRASVTVTAIQLALLALYTLALVANLVVDTRTVETTLIRARGASPRQLALAAGFEGLVLAVPAIVLGPLLAAFALRLLDDTGVLADVGLVLEPRLTVGAFVAAAAAALSAVAVLVVPAARAARSTFAGTRASRSRASEVSLAQRSGVDLALLAIAVAGLWQLRRAGTTIASGTGGPEEIDPLLVIAPALGLLAGSVLVLRLVPLLARIAIRVTTAGRGFVGSLSAWQIGRRPGRTSRALLLLVLSVAIGTFASSYAVTWSVSQEEQSVAELGADLSVAPDRRLGAGQPPVVLGAGYDGVDGVASATSAWTDRASIGGTSATLVGIDLSDPTRLLRRDDVAVGLEDLHAPAATAGVMIPGDRPDRLEFRMVATAGRPDRDLRMIVTLRDGEGLVHQMLSEPTPVDGRETTTVLQLTRTVDGHTLAVRGPLTLLGLEFVTTPILLVDEVAPTLASDLTLDVSVITIDAVTGDGRRAVDLAGASGWAARVERQVTGALPPIILSDRFGPDTIDLAATIGASASTGRTGFRFAPVEVGTLADVPVAVTGALLDAIGLARGDRFVVDISGADVPLRIDGVLTVVPTRPDDERAMLVDLPTIAIQRYLRGGGITIPTAWLLDVDPDQRAEASATLAATPFRATVSSVDERTRDRRGDPVAVGLIGALTAGLIGAGLLAGIGYLVTAVVSARQRVGEFALLRAMGVTAGETRRWLAIESMVTVGGGMVAGLALGVVLARVILPAVTMSRSGLQAVPTPRLVIPWAAIGITVVIAGALLLLVPLVLSSVLERTRVAEVLRLGDEA